MSEFSLYWRYVRLHMMSELQYKGWPLAIATTLFFVVSDPLDTLALLDRFGSIGEWTAARVLMMYALSICAFGLAELFARGLDIFPNTVRDGSFDRALLRPRSTLFQAMVLRFNLSRLARVVGGGALMIFCLRAEGAVMTAGNILMLALALVGGALTYTGVFVIASALSLFTIQSIQLETILTNGSTQVAKLPPKYMPDWLRRTFLYVMPMLAFSYYPASAICGWGEPYWTGFLALPIGAAFLGLSLILWSFGVRHYKSTGS